MKRKKRIRSQKSRKELLRKELEKVVGGPTLTRAESIRLFEIMRNCPDDASYEYNKKLFYEYSGKSL